MDRLCRLCGVSYEHVDLVHIFGIGNDENDSNLSFKIMKTLPVNISKQDQLPKKICHECETNVNNLFLFVQKCKSIETKFIESIMFKNNHNKLLSTELEMINVGKESIGGGENVETPGVSEAIAKAEIYDQNEENVQDSKTFKIIPHFTNENKCIITVNLSETQLQRISGLDLEVLQEIGHQISQSVSRLSSKEKRIDLNYMDILEYLPLEVRLKLHSEFTTSSPKKFYRESGHRDKCGKTFFNKKLYAEQLETNSSVNGKHDSSLSILSNEELFLSIPQLEMDFEENKINNEDGKNGPETIPAVFLPNLTNAQRQHISQLDPYEMNEIENGPFENSQRLRRPQSTISVSENPDGTDRNGRLGENVLIESPKSILTQTGLHCVKCDCIFSSECIYNEHLVDEHKNESFECDVCGCVFLFELQLYRHYQQVHAIIKGKTCTVCGKRTGSRSALKKHIVHAHTPFAEPLRCIICNQFYADNYCFDNHTTSEHMQNGQWVCPSSGCGKIVPNWNYLEYHFAMKHKSMNIKCPDCKYVARHRKFMDDHEWVHKVIEGCHVCHNLSGEKRIYKASGLRALRSHIILRHLKTTNSRQ